jgi:hypothetical protein
LNLTAASHVSISIAGGTPPSKTRPPIAPSGSARGATWSSINSPAAGRSRKRSIR